MEDKKVSIALDIITGLPPGLQEARYRQKLHKMSTIDTGQLPYEITFVIGMPYSITANVDVSDGLANGAVGTLVHIELDPENNEKIIRVWLKFEGNLKIGEKIRKKYARLQAELSLTRQAVPIKLRNVNITLDNERKVIVKRQQFPLVSAVAMTIHKSQGGTFSHVVYEYDPKHDQELVYVALSRATNIENLYIVTKKDHPSSFKFSHGRRNSTQNLSLMQEFKRLSLNPLQTRAKILVNFISNRQGVSFMTLNCQSLNAYRLDLTDSVTQSSNVLLLSETWMQNDQNFDIPNFNCIAHFARSEIRSAGVAIYQNVNDRANILTPNLNISVLHASEIATRSAQNIGDICSSICRLESGTDIVMAVVYISPNKRMADIIAFLKNALAEYNEEIAKLIGHERYKLPLILSGDFNVNFSTEESKILKDVLRDFLKLNMNNDPTQATTKSGTTIDAVFSRFLDKIESQTFVSYFSYHKPIISFVEHPSLENSTVITEVSEE